MTKQLTGLSAQRGAGVTSIILILVIIVIAGKLAIAIVPAQIGDYQLTKLLESQLKDANDNGDTAKQFMQSVDRQLSINADYDTTAEEVFTFTSERVGQLAIHKDYVVTNNFYANVDIVNRFEGDIEPVSAK